MPATQVIELDGSRWQTARHFYDALLGALGVAAHPGVTFDSLGVALRGALARSDAPLAITIYGSESMSKEPETVARRFVTLGDQLGEDGLPIDAAMAVGLPDAAI